MGCLKLPYNKDIELKIISSKKELNYNKSEKTLRSAYLYRFQGQEADDEIKGSGNSYNYTYRMHDPRLGRFFAVDPLVNKIHHISAYTYVNNSPINNEEVDGRWWFSKRERAHKYDPYSKYEMKMANPYSILEKQGSLVSLFPVVGTILNASAIAQKLEDPTLSVDKGDIIGLVLSGYFKATRTIVKTLSGLDKAAARALKISEISSETLSNIANNPELAESFIELEVMKSFSSQKSESGNLIGSFVGGANDGSDYYAEFQFTQAYVDEVTAKVTEKWNNIDENTLSTPEKFLYTTFGKDFMIESEVKFNLENMFVKRKNEYIYNLKNAIETYE